MNNIFAGLTDREIDVLNIIHKCGSVTKNDLIENLNIKLSTLNRAMKVLENRKLIFESGISDSSGGRRPSEFSIVQDGIYIAGVDISRTYSQVALVNLKNQVINKYQINMDADTTPTGCVDKITEAIEHISTEVAVKKGKIIGIGVGTVGPMNRETGILLHPKGFMNPEWNADVPLKELLQQKTGIPCEIDNGANTAALLEYHFGAGRGCHCIAYIHCGVGIRSAVVRDGIILRTMNDTDDAFAQMTMDINGGYLENYVSLEAIRNRYCKNAEKKITYDELFSIATGADDAATEAFRYSARILGMGISNLSKLLNPDLVILSGPLVSKFEPYYSICMKSFREHNTQNDKTVFSKGGDFKDSVVADGAALMFIEQCMKSTGR